MASEDKQLQYMQDFLVNIAHGNFETKLNISNENDEDLVAMQVGINMLVEELKTTTISRVYLNSIYDGINDILIVLNEKGEIQSTNNLVETILLYAESELINQSIDALINVEDITRVKSYIKIVYENKAPLEIGLQLISKNGTAIPVSCSFSVLLNNELKPSGILLVAKNITALLEAKNQLQDKNDELNLFVYKASHDLKTPVSSMKGLLSLASKSKDLKEMKMYFKMIEECNNKLDTIISELLVLGRITYGDLKYVEIKVKLLFDEILKSTALKYNHKDIDFSLKIDKRANFICTEKELLFTIMLNLIDNAIKYRKKREEVSFIHVNVTEQDKGLLFIIEDNGIGIESSLQENIFKMFYRATYTSKGSGLGLYIVKTSVLKLGGTISFESSVDKGTTFKVYLPTNNI